MSASDHGAPVRLAARTPREEINAVIVTQLEGLLERAKRNELESFFAMFETVDFDGMNWCEAGSLSRSQTIGRVEVLKERFVHEILHEAAT